MTSPCPYTISRFTRRFHPCRPQGEDNTALLPSFEDQSDHGIEVRGIHSVKDLKVWFINPSMRHKSLPRDAGFDMQQSD